MSLSAATCWARSMDLNGLVKIRFVNETLNIILNAFTIQRAQSSSIIIPINN